ncbi:hypothetical protein [Inhella proteolytica]|uniref:Uncharacterized protein n=1 Tax=Inhella proteolytica TaxID=2795029 RepID=A0A931IZM4_9BURK|nr:hypothetical protein [Inhella proteolytica]MBH9576741.1 hypothetical protein [Inhella proteolytica]
MSRLYYPLPIYLDSRRQFLIWYSDVTDGVLLEATGTLMRFASEATLRSKASQLGLAIEDGDAVLHDLSSIARSLHSRRNRRLDCIKALQAWNLFADVAASLPDRATRFGRLNALADREYLMTFVANNLPAVTPAGHHYEPSLSAWERKRVRKILRAGLALVRSELRRAVG